MDGKHHGVSVRRLESKTGAYPPSIIERAYQLAASGEYSTMLGIKRALQAEGYGQIDAHFSGSRLKAELARLMQNSATATAASSEAVAQLSS